MYNFLIIIERAERNFSAYNPDLPGCVASGRTREQAAANMHDAIEPHMNGLREDRLPVPKPHSFAEFSAIPV
jgi:predicted RNase H-like HicB family nuclease